jgi:hypothetical protein
MMTLQDFARISAYVDSRNLAAATAETFTRPTGYTVAVLQADADCYVKRTGTAVASVADVVDGTASVFVPAKVARIIDMNNVAPATPLASFSVISTPGGNVTVEWFP